MGSVKLGDVEITWLGHASFRFVWKKRVAYVDPYVPDPNPLSADVIVSTHDHFDHCDINVARRYMKEDTVYVGPPACAQKVPNLRVIRPGETLVVKDIKIEAVPAYNIGKPFHPKEKGYIGVILDFGGFRIYHAGDTDVIPEMKDIRADLALLPIGGTYTMDEKEAARAVELIRPRYIIPMHYNYLQGLEKDPEEFKKLVNEAEVIVLEPEVYP